MKESGINAFVFTLGVGFMVLAVYQLFIKGSIPWFFADIVLASVNVGLAAYKIK